MELEKLFENYKEIFLEENKNLATIKEVYKTILEKIKNLNYGIRMEYKTTKINKKFIEIEFLLWKWNLRKALPKGLNRMLLALEEKELVLNTYLELNNYFGMQLKKYFKNSRADINILTILEIFIEILIDSFLKDRERYAIYFKDMNICFLKDEIPLLEHITTVYELKKFILNKFCDYEDFDYNELQRIMLRK